MKQSHSNIQGSEDEGVTLPCLDKTFSGSTTPLFVLVSKEVVQKLEGYPIHIFQHKNSPLKYAYILKDDNYLSLHRFLMGLKPNDPHVVDHKNHDTLDNRYSNLRVCTRSENQRNRRKPHHSSTGKPTTSLYKGVRWHKKSRKWEAQICIDRKNKYLGLFDKEVDAALCYNQAAIKHFGQFACLNKVM